jgi:hypothetical protein
LFLPQAGSLARRSGWHRACSRHRDWLLYQVNRVSLSAAEPIPRDPAPHPSKPKSGLPGTPVSQADDHPTTRKTGARWGPRLQALARDGPPRDDKQGEDESPEERMARQAKSRFLGAPKNRRPRNDILDSDSRRFLPDPFSARSMHYCTFTHTCFVNEPLASQAFNVTRCLPAVAAMDVSMFDDVT